MNRFDLEKRSQAGRLAKAYKLLIVEIFVLIALGALVRTMDAGLACPDWPLCFGDFIPDYHPQVYLEFIHRVMAGMVGVIAVGLAVWVFRARLGGGRGGLVLLSLALLVAQIVFGGLTVLLQLKEVVVAGHLGLAVAFFATNILIYQSLRSSAEGRVYTEDREFSLGVGLRQSESTNVGSAWSANLLRAKIEAGLIGLIFLQILLGAAIAANYAAMACPDFPKCNGQWFPAFWGPVGFNVLHRLMAYVLAILILTKAGAFLRIKGLNCSPVEKQLQLWQVFLVLAQIAIGISNVLLSRPPVVSVLHLAVGVALLAVTLKARHEAALGGRSLEQMPALKDHPLSTADSSLRGVDLMKGVGVNKGL